MHNMYLETKFLGKRGVYHRSLDLEPGTGFFLAQMEKNFEVPFKFKGISVPPVGKNDWGG